MKLHVWCELVCRTCAQVICGEFTLNKRVPVESLVAKGNRRGALFKDLEPFCCQKCLDSYLKDKDD